MRKREMDKCILWDFRAREREKVRDVEEEGKREREDK